jgi:hypothetical protein
MARHNKSGGVMGGIVAFILIILGGFVVLMLVSPGIWTSFKSFFSIGDTFLPANQNYNNTFFFTAEKIEIHDTPGCSGGEAPGYTYSCLLNKDTKDINVKFRINAWNNGLKQRTFYGQPCIWDDKKNACNTDNMLQIPRSDEECTITPQQTIWCDGSSYTFNTPGTYTVHPGIICSLDPTYGCYASGMTSEAQYVNVNNFITIKIS